MNSPQTMTSASGSAQPAVPAQPTGPAQPTTPELATGAPYVSVLDLFSIGIGPSSSHTVGPMRAAKLFLETLANAGTLSQVTGMRVRLFGSLGATGVGHGTPDAVIAGLRGLVPETCDPQAVGGSWDRLHDDAALDLLGSHRIEMHQDDITLAPLTRLPYHTNGMRFEALAGSGVIAEKVYYSVGGGFVLAEGDTPTADPNHLVPYPFTSADEVLEICAREKLTIAGLAWANEIALRPAAEVAAGLDAIWRTMSDSVDTGLSREGMLPGPLKVRRRAHDQQIKLQAMDQRGEDTSIEWLQTYAMAVNEENAIGGRVVTAPTNGAAGVIPAVGRHFLQTRPDIANDERRRQAAMHTFLLTAGVIGALYKRNASISGAEAGCQGEVGSACSMAAGAICVLLGGTPAQAENAAEIAMEHTLGLTCDPVGGLVQVPCIERNAIAACTSVAAARMALTGDGTHVVSLDTVIETMRQTGADMSDKYKETSMAGLAVNFVIC